MLDGLVTKAKESKLRIWRWVLGVAIAGLVVFAAWWMKRRDKELEKLYAIKSLVSERRKDLMTYAEVEENENFASVLREEAARLLKNVEERDADILKLEKEFAVVRKRIAAAKTWDCLEAEAKGENPK